MKAEFFLCDGLLETRHSAAWLLKRWRLGRAYGVEKERPKLVPFEPKPAGELARRAMHLAESGWGKADVVKLSIGGRGLKVSLVEGCPVEIWDARSGAAWELFNAKLHPKGRHVFGGAARFEFSHCGATKARVAASTVLTAFFESSTPGGALARLSSGVHCCCCGAELTDPISISRGIGPECIKKIGAIIPAAGWFAK